MFVPFVNKNYTNTWAEYLKADSADGTLQSYYTDKQSRGIREDIMKQVRTWWANGNIICNVVSAHISVGCHWAESV